MGNREIIQTGAPNWGTSHSLPEGGTLTSAWDTEAEALQAADEYEAEGCQDVKVYH
jgi:hypothetical protein